MKLKLIYSNGLEYTIKNVINHEIIGGELSIDTVNLIDGFIHHTATTDIPLSRLSVVIQRSNGLDTTVYKSRKAVVKTTVGMR